MVVEIIMPSTLAHIFHYGHFYFCLYFVEAILCMKQAAGCLRSGNFPYLIISWFDFTVVIYCFFFIVLLRLWNLLS